MLKYLQVMGDFFMFDCYNFINLNSYYTDANNAPAFSFALFSLIITVLLAVIFFVVGLIDKIGLSVITVKRIFKSKMPYVSIT